MKREPFIYPNANRIAGVDEVGRGALMGAVVTAAVVLDKNNPIEGLTDSKKLTAKRREQLSQLIKEKALFWSLGRAEPEEIEQLNILQATLLAMQRAVKNLACIPDYVLVDGHVSPLFLNHNGTLIPSQTVIKGDLYVQQISAASILAKVARDNEMVALDPLYPEYGFAQHKGYPTKAHLTALKKYGVLPCYRKTFKPVAQLFVTDLPNQNDIVLDPRDQTSQQRGS